MDWRPLTGRRTIDAVPDHSSRDAGDILLELLTKVPDAATLELLLESHHLLRLLRAQGWTDEQIRRDLTEGKRAPGELLLAVLAKEPDTAVLLGLLGNPTPKPVKPSNPAKDPSSARNGPRVVPAIIAGLLLAAPSGWFLFVRLDVLHAPGLIVHFPGAYVLLFSALVSGLLLIGVGVRALVRGRA